MVDLDREVGAELCDGELQQVMDVADAGLGRDGVVLIVHYASWY